jgi:hypothetical protein
MTTPITFGWTQVVIFLILIVGLGLLISGIVGVRGRERQYIDESGSRYSMRKRRSSPTRGISGLLLIAIAIGIIWVVGLVQTYVSLDSKIRVAQVRANSVKNLAHTMNIELTQFDQNGKQTSDDVYEVAGDAWELQGNILKFPSWLNILGLHSGYKVTRLEGRYNNIVDENSQKHQAIELNGGDGDFFKTVYQQAWSSPFVEAAYGNAVYEPADGHTYNIVVTQTGLESIPVR